jgi:hypothetical protein
MTSKVFTFERNAPETGYRRTYTSCGQSLSVVPDECGCASSAFDGWVRFPTGSSWVRLYGPGPALLLVAGSPA